MPLINLGLHKALRKLVFSHCISGTAERTAVLGVVFLTDDLVVQIGTNIFGKLYDLVLHEIFAEGAAVARIRKHSVLIQCF